MDPFPKRPRFGIDKVRDMSSPDPRQSERSGVGRPGVAAPAQRRPEHLHVRAPLSGYHRGKQQVGAHVETLSTAATLTITT